jgi:hypothetical protein
VVPERIEEELARRAVASYLGVQVRRFEDGTSNGQVDALIEVGDGYPLEVVAEHDVVYRRLWAALNKYGHVVELGLSHDWYIRLTRSARVREIHRVILEELPPPETALNISGVMPSPTLTKLGVRAVSASPNAKHNGALFFMGPIWMGSGGVDVLGEWASRFLNSQPDVSEKLSRHGGAETHAFVWATLGSDFGAESQMSGDGPEPNRPPTLPAGITHLWVGSTTRGREVLHWSPTSGWIHTGWWTPAE